MTNYIFYHWAPTLVRKRIKKQGLVPGSLARTGDWKPPYICLGPDAQTSWVLSGKYHEKEEDLGPWDLWEVNVNEQAGYEELYFDNGRVKEIRVYDRIYKRNVWLVGQRSRIVLRS